MTTTESIQIILVDDDESEHYFLSRYFKSINLSHALLSFLDGKEFLAHMAQVSAGRLRMPSLVLLDVRMPQWDGFRILEELRNDPKLAKKPVVLMFSNSDAPSDIRRANAVGADGYQVKPIGLSQTDKVFKEFLNKYK